MPAYHHTVTLECAGTGRLEITVTDRRALGDFAVSTARWTGVPLHEVLAQVEPDAEGWSCSPRAPTTVATTSR